MSQIPHLSSSPGFSRLRNLSTKTSGHATSFHLKPVSTEISYIGCMDGYNSSLWELDPHSISPKTNSRSNSYRQFHTTCRGHRPGNSVNAPLPPRWVHPDRVHPRWMDGRMCVCGWMNIWSLSHPSPLQLDSPFLYAYKAM